MQRNERLGLLFSFFIIAMVSLDVPGGNLHLVHAVTSEPAQFQHPWTDMLSGGVWAGLNRVEHNSTILDSSQASQMFSSAALGSIATSAGGFQAPSLFTNNFRVTGNNGLFPMEDEPSIAVTNQSGHFLMVVGANSLSSGNMVAYVSRDQGTHWTGPSLLPLARGNDSFASDPGLAVDRLGTFYYSFLSIGNFFFGSGGQDDLVVATSTDGITWTNHVAVHRRPAQQFFYSNSTAELFDKPYIAVGPNKVNPLLDEIYVTFTDFTESCAFGCKQNSTIMEVHSTDGGVSWSKPVAVSPSVSIGAFTSTGRLVQGSMPAVAPNGDLYISYYDSGTSGWLNASASVMITSSLDGGAHFSTPIQAGPIPQQLSYASQGNFCCFRWWSSMFPSIDVAPDGTIYIAYGARQSKVSADPADVFLIASTNGGASWSLPNMINDQSSQNGHFFAWLKVSSDGVVHIIWADQRRDPAGIGYDIFYAEATNHGATISANTIVTDVATDTLYTIGFVGDYFNLAVYGNQVYPVWTDGRRGLRNMGRLFLFGETDIYTARLGSRDTPSVSLGSNSVGGYQTPISVSGRGLPRESFFTMKMSSVQMLSQRNGIIFFFSDTSGQFNDTIIPASTLYGAYSVELDEWVTGASLATATLYVMDTRTVLVSITGPQTASPGQNITWNTIMIPPSNSPDQTPVPTTNIEATLTSPAGLLQLLTVNINPTGPGYALTTKLPNKAETGFYTLLVVASQTSTTVDRTGIAEATLTVVTRATATTVACTPAPVQIGQATTCTATVADLAQGTPNTPTGAVDWKSSGSGTFSSSTCQLTGNGGSSSCSVTYTTGPSGTDVITANYDGDGVEAAATQPVTLVVSPTTNSSQYSLVQLALAATVVGIIGLTTGTLLTLKLRRKNEPAASQ